MCLTVRRKCLQLATGYLKVRRGGHIVPVAFIIVNGDGRREVLGMEIGTSEAEPIWTEFLRKLTRRGLRGVKLVVSDVLGRIAGTPQTRLDELLPWNWKDNRRHDQAA